MLRISDIEEINVQPTTEEDKDLDAYDNTRLVAVNTCPTWGIVRYAMHKKMPGGGRAMALEAGSACHEVFAAARIWQLREIDGRPEHADFHGTRLFGAERYEAMAINLTTDEAARTKMLGFCLEALYSCGFYDDPADKRRTLSNLEEACIAYLDRQSFKYPVWVADVDDPTAPVGIEVPFDITIEFVPSETTIWDRQWDPIKIRFIGRVDGIHVHDDATVPHENKTGSRMNDAWTDSMMMTHQVTGYCLAMSTVTQQSMSEAWVHGLALPLPRSIDFGGVVTQPVKRESHAFEEWFAWVLHTVQLERMHRDDPAHAPKYTHSCNRYFRPCSLIPFCGVPPEERADILEEMEHDTWSPLDEVSDS